MNIDWAHFTPWMSVSGGVLIGIASAAFILINGRILGISGILGGLFTPKAADAGWRIAFFLGLLAAPATLSLLAPAGFLSAPRIDASYAVIVIAGLLVGYGTRLGSGCTSGHGVCGISRLSPRSLAGTSAFMVAGFAIVFVVRHLF